MPYQNRLYMILYPNEALVASHLEPDEFAQHYQIGSIRHYTGKLVFAEIDAAFRHPSLAIEPCLKELVPHPDGAPKRTKFISSYRVVEHVALNSIRNVYLSTSGADVLRLQAQKYDKSHQPGFLRTFAQIAPLSMLVMSPLDMPEFGRYMTRAENSKGCPKLFYTQIDLNIDEFMTNFERNPFMQAPFHFLHPSKLRDAITQMRAEPRKETKGLALYCPLDQIPYRRIRHGFMFAAGDDYLFFPMPTAQQIEAQNERFWNNMD